MLSMLWVLTVGREGEKKKVVTWTITAMVNTIICKNNFHPIYLKSSELKNKGIEMILASCHHWKLLMYGGFTVTYLRKPK